MMAIGTVLSLLAVPVFNSAMTTMRLNAVASNVTAAIGNAVPGHHEQPALYADFEHASQHLRR